MPRVIAGTAKGRRLTTVRGDAVRPTADRVKESLFAVLEPELSGALVVDLCAGSGGLGIEALSRGAAFCTFVESDRTCRDAIERNLAATNLAGHARVLPLTALDAVRILSQEPGTAPSLVLADPPYADAALAVAIARQVGRVGLVRPGGLLVVERPREHGLPADVPGLEWWQARSYGRTSIVMYRAPTATG